MFDWLIKVFGNKNTAGEHSPVQTPVSQPVADNLPILNGIRYGRYSDNNKTYSKTKSWYNAEDSYKKKNYQESFNAFFDYLKDEGEDNVHYKQTESGFAFDLVQGSRKVYGESDGKIIVARVPLAVMEHANVAVMRRLLELNYTLYYSRSALDDGDTLYMVFDTEISTASPNKLYYGLRELAVKADRQDDLLIADFMALKPTDSFYIHKLPGEELEIKYKYFVKWINDALDCIKELNQDSFSGAIAYVLLAAVYRIDFLITPESKLLSELERINNLYWKKKDEVTLVERNRMIKDALIRLSQYTKEELEASVYRSKSTFAISTPPSPEKIREYIGNANRDSHWYIDNKFPKLAVLINEYGMLYNQFIYSMPKVLTDLTAIYEAVLHPGYFAEMGLQETLYNKDKNEFNKEAIKRYINKALSAYQDKYPDMKWNHDRISYESLYDFALSFSEHVSSLNLKTKRR